MVSGGHARSGPPPDPNALRRQRDGADWVHLPAAGRTGEAPGWPLSRPSPRELRLWVAEWKRPQAIVWEATGLVLEVALYVRQVATAERRTSTAAERTLVLRQMDSLGLTTGGMARNRWVIDGDSAERDQPGEPQPAAAQSAKERARLRVVS